MRLFASFWLYPLLALALIAALPGAWTTGDWLRFGIWLLAGILVWTLLEYSFHRFIFHWVPQNRRLRHFLAGLHLRHHGDTRHPWHLLVRPQYSLPISALVFGIYYLAAGSLPAAVGMIVGTWTGFLYYELVHYRIHMSKSNRGLLVHQRRWHFHHHFVDDHHCYGVTSPLWDWILGTRKPTH